MLSTMHRFCSLRFLKADSFLHHRAALTRTPRLPSRGRTLLLFLIARNQASGGFRQLGFFKIHDQLYSDVTGNGWAFPSITLTLKSSVG
jgi:hypothetical protein